MIILPPPTKTTSQIEEMLVRGETTIEFFYVVVLHNILKMKERNAVSPSGFRK